MSIVWRKTKKRDYINSIELMKFLLTPFICFWTFGFPDKIGVVEALSGFVAPAYFILSGYCILVTDRKERIGKLGRAILRDAAFFFIVLILYIGINLLHPMSRQAIMGNLGIMKSKRFWFEFFVFNIWPMQIGTNIWFIQALLFACILLLIMDALHILKFYKVILILLIVFMILSGELAAVIGFNFMGYEFIPGGTITRALPYLLVGMFIREKTESFKKRRLRTYIILFLSGAVLVIGEMVLLAWLRKFNYEGHMLGYGIMAIAICGFALLWGDMERNQLTVHARNFARRIYVLHSPVFYFLLLFEMNRAPQVLNTFIEFSSLIVYMVCLLIAVAISIVKMLIPDF